MLRRARRRDAKARLGGSPDTENKVGSTHTSQPAAGIAGPAPITIAQSGLAREPGSPHARATGACLPPTDSTLPRGPAGATAAAAARGGSRGTGDDHRQLGLGHLRNNPERSRSTTDGRAKRARAPKGRHAARRRDGPHPTAGKEGRPRHTAKGRAERVRRVRRPRATPAARRAGGRSARPGRGPHPSPSTHRDGAEERGPRAEREERSHSQGMSVPRPARLRPGPGEHNVTTSISKRRRRGKNTPPPPARPPRTGGRAHHRRSHTHSGAGVRVRHSSTGMALDAQQPARAGPRRTAFPLVRRGGGGKPGFGLQPLEAPGDPRPLYPRLTPATHPRTACPHLSRGTNPQPRAEQ